jgi:hypothetical protein
MASYGSKFAAFGGESIYEYQRAHARDIGERVRQLPGSELFDSDEAQLISKITADCRLQSPAIQFDQKTHEFVSPDTVPEYRSLFGTSPQQLIRYTLPVKGDVALLQLAPSSFQMLGHNQTPELFAAHDGIDGTIAFYVMDFGDNNNAIVQAVNAILDNLRVNAERLYNELESYNGSVQSVVQGAITTEKQRREQERKRMDDLRSQLP